MVTIPTQSVVKFLVAPLLQTPEVAPKAHSPGISLTASEHTQPLPSSGHACYLLFLLGTCQTVTSSGSLLLPCPAHGLPSLLSRTQPCAPVSTEPTTVRPARGWLGGSSQTSLCPARRFILLFPSHFSQVLLMAWGRKDGEGHGGPEVKGKPTKTASSAGAGVGMWLACLGEIRSIPISDPECLFPGSSSLLSHRSPWLSCYQAPAHSAPSLCNLTQTPLACFIPSPLRLMPHS